LAIIDKRRPAPNVAEVVNIIGDVEDRDAIIVDDLVDTAGTLCAAAEGLTKKGARAVYACITHGLLSGPAIERIGKSAIKELIITDSIPPRPDVLASPKVRVLSVAQLLSDAVLRIHQGDSLSSLFI
jgi:ribose-phosphate pyrophosphokinase